MFLQFRVVASGIPFANGIAKSPDSSMIYVASSLGSYLHVYV
jgi:sugar lactone lactonase YvrE